MAMLILSVTLRFSMTCMDIYIYIAYNVSITSSTLEAWKVPKSYTIFNDYHQGEQKGATP